MPAATCKADLLAVHHKEFAKLSLLLDQVDDALAICAFDEQVSICQIIGHRAHWISLFLGWYADGRSGKEVYFPAKGYKWNDLKAYNAALRVSQAGLGWSDVRSMLADNHAQLTAFLDGMSQADLYGSAMQGGNNAWTTGRWAEAAGPSHYRSAAKFIRKCLKSL